jgi:hypothetical protein
MQVVLFQLTMHDLTRWLAFENVRDAAVFCDHYGLGLNAFNTEVILCKDSLRNPPHQLPVGRAISLIEMKRTCSVGEVSFKCIIIYIKLLAAHACLSLAKFWFEI